MRLGSVIMAALIVTGCATSDPNRPGGFDMPPPDTDFGPTPDVEADARAYFETVLKDPASAQYRIGYVGPAYCNRGWAWGGDVTWVGQAANVYVNAKNSYGGYTGFQPYTLMWNPDGSLSRQDPGANLSRAGMGAGLCRWGDGSVEKE